MEYLLENYAGLVAVVYGVVTLASGYFFARLQALEKRLAERELNLQRQFEQMLPGGSIARSRIVERRLDKIAESDLFGDDDELLNINRATRLMIKKPQELRRMIVNEMAIAEMIEEAFEALGSQDEILESNFAAEFASTDRPTLEKAQRFARRDPKDLEFFAATKKKIQQVANSWMKSGVRRWLGGDDKDVE